MSAVSVLPPKKPERMPIVPPMSAEIAAAQKPMSSETLAPAINIETMLAPPPSVPSREFPLGTDGGGASMVSMLIAGARVSLLIGFCAAAISALIGGTIGILSGFFGGRTDTALMRVTDYFLVIPDVPLIIVIAALFGRSTWNIIVIIGVIYWTFTARLIRAQTKSVR